MVAANCFTTEIDTLDLASLHGFHRKPRVTPRDLPLLVKLMNKLARCDWDEAMKEAIVVRQDAMVKRYELCLQHKLHSFFVEAPMV